MKKTISRITGLAVTAALFCAGCDDGGGSENPNGDADGFLGWMNGYTLEVAIKDWGGDSVDFQPKRDFYNRDEKVTITAAAKDGYEFTGWYDEYEGGELLSEKNPLDITMGRNRSLRADFARITFTITFDANGAAGTAPPPQKQVFDSTLTLPGEGGLTMAGHTFSGWSAESGGAETAYRAGDAFVVGGNDTLYAQWAALSVDVGDMITVTGGAFTMGESGIAASVKDFLIGKHEVTQKLWRDVMGNNPSQFKGDSLPVENVSWDDIQEFLDALRNKTGKRYRLPTEAEWEFAAKGGNASHNYIYSGGNTASKVAVYNATKTANVGGKEANELGLYDMSGNVWEWVEDKSGIDLNENDRRIIRGGGWNDPERNCAVSRRRDWGQGGRYNDLGFRLARDP